jgi:HTH-type transcriptional regulator, transcriptional repressor of NAD biosynthesis genes
MTGTVTGLVIGKFLPPHAGHLDLITKALQRVDCLIVLLCSRSCEPIPGDIRHSWLEQLSPKAKVVHLRLSDDEPRGIDYDRWCHNILSMVDRRIDLLFSSAEYGGELAKRLRATHINVERNPDFANVSGSDILADPSIHWNAVPRCVRDYFANR